MQLLTILSSLSVDGLGVSKYQSAVALVWRTAKPRRSIPNCSLTLREYWAPLVKHEVPVSSGTGSWLGDGKAGGLAGVGRSVPLNTGPKVAIKRREKHSPLPSPAPTIPTAIDATSQLHPSIIHHHHLIYLGFTCAFSSSCFLMVFLTSAQTVIHDTEAKPWYPGTRASRLSYFTQIPVLFFTQVYETLNYCYSRLFTRFLFYHFHGSCRTRATQASTFQNVLAA